MKSWRTVLGLVILAGGVYVGYRLVPPYFNNYQFQDVVESEARMNTYGAVRRSDEELRATIVKKAAELDIPLRPEQVTIERNGTGYVITADYTIHVDLPLHPVDLNFHTSSKKE